MLKDGRKSFTEFAKECGESKANISKRYKNLEKAGIIVGSTIQLDYASLGYNAVGSIIFRISPENCDNAIEKLSGIPNVYHAVKNPSCSTVNVVVTLKNMDEFNRIKEFTKRFPSVSDITTNVWMGIRNIPENLSLLKEANTEKNFKPTLKTPIDIDDNDKILIQKLAHNGRIPFVNIAKDLNIGTNTVINKYNRLKENGVIKVSIQVDPSKLGYKARACFNLAFNAESELSTIVEELSMIPDVKLLIKTSGRYDLSVFTLAKDLEQLVTQQEEIYKVAEITKREVILGRPPPRIPGFKEYISTF